MRRVGEEARLAGRHWVVDGMNVIGSRPDGWWRDRPGAQRRLVDELARSSWPEGSRVTVVFDGRPWAPEAGQDADTAPAGASRPDAGSGRDAGSRHHAGSGRDAGSRPDVLFAQGGRNAADGRIVELVAGAPDAAHIVVVTSDRALAGEVTRRGAHVVGPTRLPSRLPSRR